MMPPTAFRGEPTGISVLIPSRGRPEQLRESILSLAVNAVDRTNVAYLVACDEDDDETFRASCMLAIDESLSCHTIRCPGRYGYSQLFRYYNDLAERATGEWLLLWNDDAVMTTLGWDKRIAELEPKVLVADLRSNMSAGGWICFPAMRRKMYEALGHYSAPTAHVDSYLQDIGRALGVTRTVDVWVDHRRPDLTGETPDATFLEGRFGLDHEGYFRAGGPIQQAIKEGIERVRAVL